MRSLRGPRRERRSRQGGTRHRRGGATGAGTRYSCARSPACLAPLHPGRTAPTPIPIRSARGARLIAADGREYLDLISSWWVTLHGHSHPAIPPLARQAAEFEQVIFAGFTHQPAIDVAARVAAAARRSRARLLFRRWFDLGRGRAQDRLPILVESRKGRRRVPSSPSTAAITATPSAPCRPGAAPASISPSTISCLPSTSCLIRKPGTAIRRRGKGSDQPGDARWLDRATRP